MRRRCCCEKGVNCWPMCKIPARPLNATMDGYYAIDLDEDMPFLSSPSEVSYSVGGQTYTMDAYWKIVDINITISTPLPFSARFDIYLGCQKNPANGKGLRACLRYGDTGGGPPDRWYPAPLTVASASSACDPLLIVFGFTFPYVVVGSRLKFRLGQ